MWFANTFSHSIGCFPILLMCPLLHRSFLVDVTPLVLYAFSAFVFGFKYKEIIAKTNIKELATCFLLEVLQFQMVNSSLNPFLVDFHLRVQFSIFHLFKYYKRSSYYLTEMDQNLTMYELRDDCNLE